MVWQGASSGFRFFNFFSKICCFFLISDISGTLESVRPIKTIDPYERPDGMAYKEVFVKSTFYVTGCTIF